MSFTIPRDDEAVEALTARVFPIAGRQEAFPAAVRHPEQFLLDRGERRPAEIVLGAGWSLYCLDVPGDRAVFVELPATVDLGEASFVFAAQYLSAERAAVVPLGTLDWLATQVGAADHVALVMSTGRCGSTLASRLFRGVPGVRSLSEPDWFTNLAFAQKELSPDRLRGLIRSCLRLTSHQAGVAKRLVLKPRSEMMLQATAYSEVMGGTRGVFLYRDCFGYVNSIYRFAQRMQGVKDPPRGSPEWEAARQMTTVNATEAMLNAYFGPDEDVGAVDLMALGWAVRMRAYLEASRQGMRAEALHYDDLNGDRVAGVEQLLRGCGIDVAHMGVRLDAFAEDAHAGSAGANDVQAEPLSPGQRARVEELVSRWGLRDYVTARLP